MRSFILIAATLVGIATFVGAWSGRQAVTTESKTILSSAHPAANQNPTAPVIELPRPLAISRSSNSTEPARTQTADARGPEIVAGGVTAGQAVERMWETTSNQAWQVRAEPLTPPNWFITGVVRRGEKTKIIVQFDTEPRVRFFQIGDVLPGGGKLVWVRPNTIGVATSGRKQLDIPLLPAAADTSVTRPPSR